MEAAVGAQVGVVVAGAAVPYALKNKSKSKYRRTHARYRHHYQPPLWPRQWRPCRSTSRRE